MVPRLRLKGIFLLPLFLICIFAAGKVSAVPIGGQEPVRRMKTEYAVQFSVDYYENGSKLLTLADGQRFLVLPEGTTHPQGIDPDIAILQQPVRNIYLAATAAMCLFDALDRLEQFPYLGSLHPDQVLAAMEYRRIVTGNYVCVYRVIDHKIVVYRIVNGATDYPRFLY